MTIAPNYMYIRIDEYGKCYATNCDDEEYIDQQAKKYKRVIDHRRYGNKEELIKKYNGYHVKFTDIIYTVRDETDPKFREKWLFNESTQEYTKNGNVLSQQLIDTYLPHEKIVLNTTREKVKDRIFETLTIVRNRKNRQIPY